MIAKRELVQKGRAWLFGDDIPNDGGIMPIEMTRQIVYDPVILAKHAMSGIDPQFASHVKPSDFIIAGKNFGKGQFHVQGPLGLAALQVGILSESMSRSFFRMSVAVGLPVIPFASGLKEFIQQGDSIEVEFSTGVITNHTQVTQRQVAPIPSELCEIILAGGERKWLGDRMRR